MTSNIILFTFRNMKVFFRDRMAVLSSMFAAIIVIALYFLFLGDMLTKELSETVPGARAIVDSWAMAGVMAVTPVTAALGALGIMIQDKINGAIRDITVSPMKRYEIVSGYVLSTFVITVLLSFLALAFAEAYIVLNGGSFLTGMQFVKVVGLVLLSSVSASAMMLLVALFITSNNVYSGVSTIVGTIIGFITGVFIPIGMLPDVMGTVVKMVPASHSATLFRQVMMETPMEAMAGMPPEEILEFELSMGVRFEWGDGMITPETSLIILAAVAAVFFMLAVLKLSTKTK